MNGTGAAGKGPERIATDSKIGQRLVQVGSAMVLLFCLRFAILDLVWKLPFDLFSTPGGGNFNTSCLEPFSQNASKMKLFGVISPESCLETAVPESCLQIAIAISIFVANGNS